MRELLDTEYRTAPCAACGSLEIVHGFGPVCAVCGSQLTEHEPRPGDSYLKHVGSWLLDLPVRVEYDDETRTVTLAADEFDSALISDFVIRGLACIHGRNRRNLVAANALATDIHVVESGIRNAYCATADLRERRKKSCGGSAYSVLKKTQKIWKFSGKTLKLTLTN